MSTCHIDHSDYINNGLITKIWGSPGWIFGHAVTFGYPINPTEEQKNKYKNYFISLGDVLPCRFCRESYQKFITTGETALTAEALTNRNTLTKWFYNVHEAVNRKLEVDYGVTYEDVVDKYESYRAKCSTSNHAKGCAAPPEYKALSFKNFSQNDCPIIPLEIAKPFIELARLRELDDRYFIFLELVYEFQGDFFKLKKLEAWCERNKFCQKQIRYMRENGISSIETSGPWKGTPTLEELKLLVFLSSNLNKTELRDCMKALISNQNYFTKIKSIY